MYRPDQDTKHPTQESGFSYTYSAADREELKRIRSKYLPEEEDKWERLRALDASVTERASIVALILGIISALLLGIGMCCVLVWGTTPAMVALGIGVGLLGVGGIIAAYPVYLKIMNKQKARVAPEIIRLTDELMK